MKAYKGLDKDLKCRDFQYEVGGEYTEDKAELCNSGFHACEYPLDCFSYYPPTNSRFCEVELDEVSDERHSDDSKVCAKKIKIGAEIGIAGLIKATFEYVKSHCITDKQGEDCTALTGGDLSALTGGYRSVVYGGEDAKVRAGKGSVLALQYWKDDEFISIKFKEVDGVKIKADTFYKLDNAGCFVEVKEEETK